MGDGPGLSHTGWYEPRRVRPMLAGSNWCTVPVVPGKLQHQVVSPNRRVKKRLGKTYIVQTWRGLQGNEAEIFKSGTLLLNGEKKPCKPAELEVLDPANNIAKCALDSWSSASALVLISSTRSSRLTLYEGKYHQIRRMFSGSATLPHCTSLPSSDELHSVFPQPSATECHGRSGG